MRRAVHHREGPRYSLRDRQHHPRGNRKARPSPAHPPDQPAPAGSQRAGHIPKRLDLGLAADGLGCGDDPARWAGAQFVVAGFHCVKGSIEAACTSWPLISNTGTSCLSSLVAYSLLFSLCRFCFRICIPSVVSSFC